MVPELAFGFNIIQDVCAPNTTVICVAFIKHRFTLVLLLINGYMANVLQEYTLPSSGEQKLRASVHFLFDFSVIGAPVPISVVGQLFRRVVTSVFV